MTRALKTAICFQLSAMVLPFMLLVFIETALCLVYIIAVLVSQSFANLLGGSQFVVLLAALTIVMYRIERFLVQNGLKRCRGIPELALNLSILMCWFGYLLQWTISN